VCGSDLDVAAVVPLVELNYLILGAHRVESLLGLGGRRGSATVSREHFSSFPKQGCMQVMTWILPIFLSGRGRGREGQKVWFLSWHCGCRVCVDSRGSGADSCVQAEVTCSHFHSFFMSEYAHYLLSRAVCRRDLSGCSRLCGQVTARGVWRQETRGGYLDAEGAEGLGEDHNLVLLDGAIDNLLVNSGKPSAVAIARPDQRSWSTRILHSYRGCSKEAREEASRGLQGSSTLGDPWALMVDMNRCP